MSRINRVLDLYEERKYERILRDQGYNQTHIDRVMTHVFGQRGKDGRRTHQLTLDQIPTPTPGIPLKDHTNTNQHAQTPHTTQNYASQNNSSPTSSQNQLVQTSLPLIELVKQRWNVMFPSQVQQQQQHKEQSSQLSAQQSQVDSQTDHKRE